MSAATPASLESRLARVERALAAISTEVAAIRAELNGAQASSAVNAETTATVDVPLAAAASPAAAHERRRKDSTPLDFERLLGRYGMLAIAVLAAVAAVGTFLSWAIRNGYLRLGPEARVLVGLAFATGLAAWGLRLRARERSFGSSILALALVIIQVCAYAAGPGFHLVPTLVAFAGVAFLSWALAIFAHAEDDEPLWCVGFGGAALAPFVTSDGTGNVYALLAYALVVLLPACFAISGRSWPIAWRVFYLVSALFTLVGADLGHRTNTTAFLLALALPFVIAAAGVVPFAPDDRKRAALRWLGLLGALASFGTPLLFTSTAWVVAATVALLAGLWLFLLDRQAFLPQSSLLRRTRDSIAFLDWIDAAIIPLALFFEMGEALRNIGMVPAAHATGVAMLVAFTWRRAVNSLRDASAFAAVVLASGVLASAPLEEPLGKFTAFVVLALVVLAAHRAKPSMSWLGSGLFILFVAALVSVEGLTSRRAYLPSPFMTEPTLTAVVLLIGLVIVARFWHWMRTATRVAMGERPEWTYARAAQLLLRGVTTAPWIWAFVWIMLELAWAYSASTSTLLLVTYFAATAVACVGAGRARHSARLRQVGLMLALVAALTAFYGATTWFDFGARIVAYLVTSAFLLGIAYWYRKPGGLETAGDATV